MFLLYFQCCEDLTPGYERKLLTSTMTTALFPEVRLRKLEMQAHKFCNCINKSERWPCHSGATGDLCNPHKTQMSCAFVLLPSLRGNNKIHISHVYFCLLLSEQGVSLKQAGRTAPGWLCR